MSFNFATVNKCLAECVHTQRLLKNALLAFFASFVLESEIVQQIMRWDMAVLQESPWYNEILSRGEQAGRQAGRQEGRQEEAIALILRQLNRRLGQLSPGLIQSVSSLSSEMACDRCSLTSEGSR
jgi:predicted transposase YdaD